MKPATKQKRHRAQLQHNTSTLVLIRCCYYTIWCYRVTIILQLLKNFLCLTVTALMSACKLLSSLAHGSQRSIPHNSTIIDSYMCKDKTECYNDNDAPHWLSLRRLFKIYIDYYIIIYDQKLCSMDDGAIRWIPGRACTTECALAKKKLAAKSRRSELRSDGGPMNTSLLHSCPEHLYASGSIELSGRLHSRADKLVSNWMCSCPAASTACCASLLLV